MFFFFTCVTFGVRYLQRAHKYERDFDNKICVYDVSCSFFLKNALDFLFVLIQSDYEVENKVYTCFSNHTGIKQSL